MAQLNILDLLTPAEKIDPTYDFQPKLQALLDGRDSAFLRVRRNQLGKILPYRLASTLKLPGGSTIVCEGPDTVVEGPPRGTLILTESLHRGALVRGGRWGKCDTFWRHVPGKYQSLAEARFENVEVFETSSAGFDIVADSIGNVWRNCSFVDCGVGVRFQGNANINRFENCRFRECSAAAVHFDQDRPNRLGCYFVRCTVADNKCGLVVDSQHQGLHLRLCRFERNQVADLVAKYHGGSSMTTLVTVKNCNFGAPHADQRYRIRYDGRVSLLASSNVVQFYGGHEQLVFAECAAWDHNQWNFKGWLLRNRLSSVPSGQYDKRLHRDSGPPQCLEITPA